MLSTKNQMQLHGDRILHKLMSCVSECCLQSFLYLFALQQMKQLGAGAHFISDLKHTLGN